MRSLSEVIKVVKNLVPDDFVHRDDLFKSLDDIIDSYSYAAPEMLGFWWGQAGEVLGGFLGTPQTSWERTIQGVFADQIDYKLYRRAK